MTSEVQSPGPHNHNLYPVLSEKERSLLHLLRIPNKGLQAPVTYDNLVSAVWIGSPDEHNESAILAVSQKNPSFIDRLSGNWSIGMEQLEIDPNLDNTNQRRELARVAFDAARHPVDELKCGIDLLRRFANLPYAEL